MNESSSTKNGTSQNLNFLKLKWNGYSRNENSIAKFLLTSLGLDLWLTLTKTWDYDEKCCFLWVWLPNFELKKRPYEFSVKLMIDLQVDKHKLHRYQTKNKHFGFWGPQN